MHIERHDYLIGDYEREYALHKLNNAVQSGHLTLSEFDRRAEIAARAHNQGDIDALLRDIPDNLVVKVNRTSGLQKRWGILALNLCLVPVACLVAPQLAVFMALMLPVLFVLLFILKVGPDELYQSKTTYQQIEK